MMVAANWTYISVATLIFTVWFNKKWRPTTYCSMIKVLLPGVYVGFYVVNFVGALLITMVLHLRIFREARIQARQIQCNCISANNTGNNNNSNDRKVTKMMSIVFGTFLACWVPYTFFNSARALLAQNSPVWLDILYKLTLSICYSNSFMNPIIYGWKNRSFREAYTQLLTCKIKQRFMDFRVSSHIEE